MLDEIVGALKDQVGSSLMENLGLNSDQSNDSLKAAASSVTDVLSGGDGFDIGDVLNLFSKNDNTNGADGIMANLGSVFMNKLTGEVGLDQDKATGVQDILMPKLMDVMSSKVGGDQNALSGLLGGMAGNLLGGNKGGGLLGTVGKLFGK